MKIRSKLFSVILVIVFSLGMLAWGQIAIAAPEQQQAQFVAPRLVVNSSFLNVRTGPGIQYNVLITVVGGTELPVLARVSDNVWFQVSTVVGVGAAHAGDDPRHLRPRRRSVPTSQRRSHRRLLA